MKGIRGFGRSPRHLLIGIVLVLLIAAALCAGPTSARAAQQPVGEVLKIPSGDPDEGCETFQRLADANDTRRGDSDQ